MKADLVRRILRSVTVHRGGWFRPLGSLGMLDAPALPPRQPSARGVLAALRHGAGTRATRRLAIAYRLVALVLLPVVLTGSLPLAALPLVLADAPDSAAPAAAVGAPAPAAPAEPAAAVPPAAAGQRIAAIEFKGLKTLSEETLLYYLGLKIGETVDEDKLNRSIKSLWDRGLVDDVKIDYAAAQGSTPGVKLTITVQERPILKSIDYVGLKRISKTDIQDKISTQRIKVREGEPMSLGELQRVKSLIEDLYREKGFRFAQANYTVTDLAGNDKKVVFKVDEGDRVRIAKIEFTGNHVFGGMRLRWAMKDTKTSNWITRILKKDVYDPAKLQEDLDKIRDLYKGAGYKNIAIGEPKVEVRAENPKAAEKDQKRRMIITIPIEESDRWKLGNVTLDGNKIYKDPVLLRAFSLHTGDWLKAKVLDDSIKKINDTYHNTGYVFARVEPELTERPGNVADLAVHISEGDQFKVGRIEFTGNERTQDKVLRREVRLFEGGLVNIQAVKNSVLKINQLGYFKLNEEDPVDIDTNSEKKEVNLVFKGAEANRTELQFGGGWSELDGFFVQFSISTKNFLGRGESVGVSVQTGRYRKVYDINYSIPWWLDKPQNLGFRAFISDLDYTALNTDYIQKAKGVVVTYGRNLGLFNSWSVSYNFTRHDDSENLVTAINSGVGVIGTPPQYFINTSSIKPAYVYDSRNDPFSPVRGLRLAASLEYGGGPLGGNDNFLRPDLGASVFVPVTNAGLKTVFAFNVEGGWLHPTTSSKLSPLEYFFIGGENSVRGFRFRSITVRDDKGNPVFDIFGNGVGGDKYIQMNAEYHFLVGGPFRVLIFTDAGNVYGQVGPKEQSFDLSQLRQTAGVELRVTLPILGAPLRFIYSKNLRPLPFDEFETFQFSIGTSF
jgi:outer membrane protein insertion porin family